MFVPNTASRSPGHRFYEKLNELLEEARFDASVERLCEPFYDSDRSKGRQSIPPGIYFRMLLIGYFEGIESERGICWRCEDSLSLRDFLGLELTDRIPDHSTLSRTRHRLDKEVFDAVFRLVLSVVEEHGLLKGRVVGVDSTYLRADASMKSIVRRDTGDTYPDYLEKLAEESGIEHPTAEDARRMDRGRKKKTSNKEWASPTDPDARVTRLKDGRTRLGYKAEHTTDLDTGAILAADIHPADASDSATMAESLDSARQNIVSDSPSPEGHSGTSADDDDDGDPSGGSGGTDAQDPGPRTAVDVVADKGYYKTSLLSELEEAGFRPHISEPRRPHRRNLKKLSKVERRAVIENRRRGTRAKSKKLQRRRGEMLERTFAHVCETGGARRTRLRGRENVAKRYLMQAAAANLGLVMRTMLRAGTPRGWADLRVTCALFSSMIAQGLHRLRPAQGTPRRPLTDTIQLLRRPHLGPQPLQLSRSTGSHEKAHRAIVFYLTSLPHRQGGGRSSSATNKDATGLPCAL